MQNSAIFSQATEEMLQNITIYPDFTIRHPRTGEIYYWEHFGKMADSTYAKKTFKKMELYNSNGIYPSINLIMTFETLENQLTLDEIEEIINHYFF